MNKFDISMILLMGKRLLIFGLLKTEHDLITALMLFMWCLKFRKESTTTPKSFIKFALFSQVSADEY